MGKGWSSPNTNKYISFGLLRMAKKELSLQQPNTRQWNSLEHFVPLYCWELWKHRNSVVFDNAPFNPNLHYTCIRLATEYFFCVSKSHKEKHTIATPMCWQKPPKGWYKLNSDGASLRNPGKPGGGKLIHDFHGNWVKGYMR